MEDDPENESRVVEPAQEGSIPGGADRRGQAFFESGSTTCDEDRLGATEQSFDNCLPREVVGEQLREPTGFHELHCRTGMPNGCGKILEHPHHRHGNPGLGLQRHLHVVPCLGKRLAIEVECDPVVGLEDMDAGESPERASAFGTKRGSAHGILEEAPGATRVARLEMMARRVDRPLQRLAGPVRRGQSDRLVCELGGGRGCARARARRAASSRTSAISRSGASAPRAR